MTVSPPEPAKWWVGEELPDARGEEGGQVKEVALLRADLMAGMVKVLNIARGGLLLEEQGGEEDTPDDGSLFPMVGS